MNYSFADIVDIPQLQTLLEEFYTATGIPSGIIDIDGRLLVSVGWRDICAKFHRHNQESALLCRESDIWIQEHLDWQQEYSWHNCAHGLIDAAAPIIVEGKPIAAIFQGQFLFAPPDEAAFRRQAAKYGFEEEAYLQALAKVPVYSKEKLDAVMKYFRRFAEMIAQMGLAHLQLQQLHAKSLRESAERLNTIINRSPSVAIQSYDLTGRVLFWNKASENIFDWSEAEAVGKTMDRLILSRSDAAEFSQAIRDCDQSHQPVSPRTWTITTKYGVKKNILSAMFPIYLDNQLTEFICMDVDISDQKNSEKEVTRLEQLHLVGEMAANIGHEIRNPMTTVRGFLQLLSAKDDCRCYQDFFDLMIKELDQANAVITEFLSLAKNKVIQLEMRSLNQIISGLAPLIEVNLLSPDQQLKLNLGQVQNLPLDEKDMRRLVLHLARNGIEAMSGRGNLTISTFMEDGNVVLAVQDEGWGIKAEMLENLGRPFHSTKEHNPGLGLAVCYSIAARHNARISVDSSPHGTTFYLTFNLENDAASSVQPASGRPK